MSSIPAIYGLNRYLWAKIQDAGILDPANYGGLIPIIPNKEVPELQQAMDIQDGIQSFPYIVYSWATNGYDQMWFKATDQLIYLINSQNGGDLRNLVALISNHFKRYDESARAVNEFIEASELSDEYKAYDYKNIHIKAAQVSTGGSNENEPDQAMITVSVTYTNTANDTPLTV